jgi:hypothetical protein
MVGGSAVWVQVRRLSLLSGVNPCFEARAAHAHKVVFFKWLRTPMQALGCGVMLYFPQRIGANPGWSNPVQFDWRSSLDADNAPGRMPSIVPKQRRAHDSC